MADNYQSGFIGALLYYYGNERVKNCSATDISHPFVRWPIDDVLFVSP